MKTNCLCDTATPRAFAAEKEDAEFLAAFTLLKKDELWHSTDRKSGVAIQVLDGLLWITEEGNPADYILQKGERFSSLGTKRVVAQSLGAAARIVVS